MRSVRFHRHGGLDVLQVDAIEPPRPGPHEVAIDVRACGVNQVDILSRRGETPAPIPLPHASGTEVAGIVSALGSDVTGWAIGDEVIVNPTLSCGECDPCREGRDNVCRYGRIFGVQTLGGYSEVVTAPARDLIAIPDGLAFESAAAVTVTGSTAWHMLIERASLRIGDTVLIVAAGSGIGVIGIQIARHAGARVIATASSESKRHKALELGAHEVVDHSEPGWGRRVRALTGGQGVDVVFEHVGAATWSDSLDALSRNGRLVTCGGHSGFDVTINLWHLFVKEQVLIGSFAGTRRDLESVLELTASGVIRPVIHDRFDLADAAEAQLALEQRSVFGKLVLTGEAR